MPARNTRVLGSASKKNHLLTLPTANDEGLGRSLLYSEPLPRRYVSSVSVRTVAGETPIGWPALAANTSKQYA